MFSLIPREVRFFDLFEQQSQHMIQGAALLYELVHNFADARAKAHAIKEVEHQGDQVTHEIVKRLNTTFITPIDREDIHDLASRMDDLVDLIDAVASRAVLFRVGGEIPDAADLARIIHQQAVEIQKAVVDLRDAATIMRHCARINQLEKDGDKLYREAMARIFDSGRDPIFVIKAKEIIETLEAATDAGEDIAIVLERIILKHQ